MGESSSANQLALGFLFGFLFTAILVGAGFMFIRSNPEKFFLPPATTRTRSTLYGVCERRDDTRFLVRFNEEEQMWITLVPGYSVWRRSGESVQPSTLDEMKLGSDCALSGLGVSSVTREIIYADELLFDE